jgi:hypothetical protein
MFYKLLTGIFILQGTIFGADNFSNDLEIGRRVAAKTPAKSDDNTCCRIAGSIPMLGAATMHSLAAWYAWQEIQTTEDPRVKKSLMASIVGNSIAAAGTTFSALIAPFSGEGEAKCVQCTYSLSFSLSNIPTWVAIGIEDNTSEYNTTGVGENLKKSAYLSSLALIPNLVGICWSAIATGKD